jgi:hypothetical protein
MRAIPGRVGSGCGGGAGCAKVGEFPRKENGGAAWWGGEGDVTGGSGGAGGSGNGGGGCGDGVAGDGAGVWRVVVVAGVEIDRGTVAGGLRGAVVEGCGKAERGREERWMGVKESVRRVRR